jgi:hypothetical protein
VTRRTWTCFLRRQDCERALAVLADAGFATEFTFPHWLGKAYAGDRFIDLIYSAGNGVARRWTICGSRTPRRATSSASRSGSARPRR